MPTHLSLAGLFALMTVTVFCRDGGLPTGFSLAGQWSSLYYEDELERTEPSPSLGEHTGLPITDASRYRADTHKGDLTAVMEHQFTPHNAIYSLSGPANLTVRAERDLSTGNVTPYVIDGGVAAVAGCSVSSII